MRKIIALIRKLKLGIVNQTDLFTLSTPATLIFWSEFDFLKRRPRVGFHLVIVNQTEFCGLGRYGFQRLQGQVPIQEMLL